MSSAAIIGIVITITMVILGFCFKKNRIVSMLQLLWIFVLMALNTGGGDFVGNQATFELSEPGYNGLFSVDLYRNICYFFRTNGFDFIAMNVILCTLSIAATYYVVRKNTKNRNAVLSLFMIFPMFDLIMQKRAFYAMPLVLFAMDYLLSDKDTKKRYILSTFLVFIASQIHSSYFFFFVIIALNFIKEKVLGEKRYRKTIIALIVGSLLLIPVVPSIFAGYFSVERIELYFSGSNISTTSALAWITIHIGFVVFQKLLMKRKEEKDISLFDKNVYSMNIGTLLLLPLYFFESAFFRVFKTILIFNYASAANRLGQKGVSKKPFLLFLVYILILFGVVYMWTGHGFDVLITPLFDNNMLIGNAIGG